MHRPKTLPSACFHFFALTLWCLFVAGPPVQSRVSTTVSGSGFTINTLTNGGKAFAIRDYVWQGVPDSFNGWQFTQVSGGSPAQITIQSSEDGDVYVATVDKPAGAGWQPVPGGTFAYSDNRRTKLNVYRLHLTAQTSLQILQTGWAGTIVLSPTLTAEAAPLESANPPGTVIDYQAVSTQAFVGSPSIAILSDGTYVASHDIFGPGTGQDVTEIFRSSNRGATWQPAARLKGQFWSSLFVHQGALYLLGTSREFGQIAIRRSIDGGATWTSPRNSESGMLTQEKGMHCAPTPVIEANGRVWRAFEHNPPGVHGRQFQAFVISAPVDADLLRTESWTRTNLLDYNLSETGGNWLEGNVILAPDGSILDILRIDRDKFERAAVLHVSADGSHIGWNSAQDRISFFGGASKFTIRYDPVSHRYWTLVNKQRDPDARRNILSLTSSADLIHWKVEATLLSHPDREKHAFQYVDWLFDGDDIVAVSRTSWNGDTYHNANYLTFHRIRSFRTDGRSMGE